MVNRSYLLDNNGAIVARYDKLHLFDVDLPSGEQYREIRDGEWPAIAPCWRPRPGA